jgi:diguanylate cyclase (GGDEF)-like protein
VRRAAESVLGWGVWSLPGRLLGSVLLVDLLAFSLVLFDALTTSPTIYASALVGGLTLLFGAILHSEVSLRLERVRRRLIRETANIDLSSVWTFAAVILLPVAMASMLIIAIYLYLHFRVWRPAKSPAYRQVFNTSTVVLAAHAAAGIVSYVSFGVGDPLHSGTGPVAVLAAMLAYTVVNTCLVVGVVVVSSNKSVREILGHGDELVLEAATLSLGALVALAVSAGGPVLVVFSLPPLLVLHRAVMARQLERAADTDGKTGLLTAAAWHRLTVQYLQRMRESDGSAAVLILDLDHFKQVNDTHGHLAGDAVLRNVAMAVQGEVREQDLVGRFGGEEFVVLLPRPDEPTYTYVELQRIAERIRRSVARLAVTIPTPDGPLTINDVSVSIGGAVAPEDGVTVQDLVAAADSALYAAKRAGRNAVRLGQHDTPGIPPPREPADVTEPPG